MTFFIMQLRNSGRKNRGQRYTKEEKCTNTVQGVTDLYRICSVCPAKEH